MSTVKKIIIIISVIIGFLFIISIDGLTDLAFSNKITISDNLPLKNFKNYPEIGQALVNLYNSENPEEWSKIHSEEFYRALEFLNDYTVWELQQPTSTAKKFFQQLATENQRQIVCLE